MTRLAVLIPEFPGQTHAFFMREKAAMESMGATVSILSTQHPVAKESEAKHEWAQAAAKEAVYLAPFSAHQWFSALSELLRTGPIAWWRCMLCVLSADVSLKEKCKLAGMVLVGAYLKRHCAKHSIEHIHVHSCANAANVALFNRLLNGTPYSLTLHGPMQDYGFNQAAKWQHAKFVVVITQELLAEAKDRLQAIPLPPLYLAPMGVNIDDFQRQSTYTPPSRDGIVKLVSCGRIHPVKAHDDLIRAVAELKKHGVEAELVICGAPDSHSYTQNYSAELDVLTKELNLEKNVIRLGSVSEQRVKQALEDAHIFCLASLKEPLGVATMEAMAMSMPVIVARSPGVEEMIVSGEDGFLVEPRAPEQFTQAILKLIDQPEHAAAIAAAGRRKVEKSFHSGVSAKVILEGVVSSV